MESVAWLGDKEDVKVVNSVELDWVIEDSWLKDGTLGLVCKDDSELKEMSELE